jgi:DNA ligase-associated metallophosphoesterase
MNLHQAAIRGHAEPGRAGISIAGEEAVLDWRGCAYFPRLRLIAVSDLHLEKGSSFARRGIFIPPYDTDATLARLAAVIGEFDPVTVICVGDSFHDPGAHCRLPPETAEEIGRLACGRDWCWIRGNHDPLAPAGLAGFSAAELAVGPLLFRHEPAAGAEAGEVAGHLHPGAVVRRRGRAVRRPCFACDGRRMILPAFGAYTGSLNVRSDAFDGLFDRDDLRAFLLGDGAIFPIAGAHLSRG